MTSATDILAGDDRAARDAAGGLQASLDFPLPREIAVGAGTALFVCGWCFHPAARIRELSLIVDGEDQPVMAHGMPRLEVLCSLHPGLDPYATAGMASDPESREDPLLHSYRSGFWGMARIVPHSGQSDVCELLLRAELDDGTSTTVELARIRLVELARGRDEARGDSRPAAPASVAICMATYNPPAGLLEHQIESIQAQTHRDWVCLISDDCSSPDRFAAIEAAVAGDDRFVVSRAPRRLGFYRNFERALTMVPAGVEHVALSDQDDRWHPDKLEALVAALGHAQLVYSDARVVDEDGALLSDTYWVTRRNNHKRLASLLVTNSVTGAASLMRREVLDDALPFPPAQFAHFHDHWIGLIAVARGDIAYVERPLYDYVQHGEASLGHVAANRMPGLRERVGSLRRHPRERVRLWRMHYFVDIARLLQFATIARMRCGERMAPDKRRALDRFLGADRSRSALAGMWLRGARELVGSSETLGAEWMLAHALTWRRLLSATTRDRPTRGLRLDAEPPPSLTSSGRHGTEEPSTRAIADKIAPLELVVRDDAPERVNVLIPTIDLEHFFGGYIAKLNLARRLADRGLRVRIVTVDPVSTLLSWPQRVEAYAGLEGLFDRVEVVFGREAGGVEVSRSDHFVATTWWSAHVASAASRSLGRERFLYLIQEYEPFTFPMGTYAALARGSYDLPHDALFSTELLRDYFRRHAIGVYADGEAAGDDASAAFENAITSVAPPSSRELAGRGARRLLFYARPEDHAARNMFELGVLALNRALELGAFRDGWELHGIGTLETGRRLELGHGAELELLPRSAQDDYARVLREHDVGLALMYTPHPSLVPIEMASAGMLTVTNRFENKTPAALAAISSNLIAAEPTIEALAAALAQAAAESGDFERRAAGSAVRWSRDWDTSFDDALLARIVALLTG